MQGGGTAQFSAIPLNLSKNEESVTDYVITGGWSKKAYSEGLKFSKANIIFNGISESFTTSPKELEVSKFAEYVYFCSNETIHGVELLSLPLIKDGGEKPIIVVDMSSNFLSRPINVQEYGVIFAGAQKNGGIAGLSIVIIKKTLLNISREKVPSILSFKITEKENSLANTPPTFAIYVSGLVFKWLLKSGGLKDIEKKNIEKSSLLYDYIDCSKGYYVNNVEVNVRSRMNVPIKISFSGNNDLEKLFIKEAKDYGIIGLNGHHSIGGLRISLYNSITIENVKALIVFMESFKEKHPI